MIYVAPTAVVVGDVSIEDGASVWHGAVLRGDFDAVVLGRDSNVQDNVVVHVDRGMPATIGARVTVGHAAVVHGCTIEDDCLIGMNATINSGAVIGRGSLVASGAVVREMDQLPPASVIAGVPAKTIGPGREPHRRRNEIGRVTYNRPAQQSLPARPHLQGSPSRQIALGPSDEMARLVRKD